MSSSSESIPSPARLPRAIAAVLSAALITTAAVVGAPAAHAVTGDVAWADLETRLEELLDEASADSIRMGITVEDLSGTYGGGVLSTGSQEPYKAASIIKLPLLALLMDYADAGTLSLDELITIPAGDSNIVGGSGTLRNRTFPLDISVRELMELMVQVSDNTATNVLIDRAGGFAAVNGYIDSLGYDTLWLGRKMIHPATPPLGENWINSDEVTALISSLYRHEILSAASSEHIIDLMKGQLVNTKFGAVIPREHLGNKTGELADVSHDSGIIFLDGREVSLTVATEFSSNRPRAEVDLYVQQAATIVYEFLQEPVDAPVVPVPVPLPESGVAGDAVDELAATGSGLDAAVSIGAAIALMLGVGMVSFTLFRRRSTGSGVSI